MEVQSEATRRRTCATYAGDMHALELHLLEAFERQLAITKELPDAHALVESLISTSKRHAKMYVFVLRVRSSVPKCTVAHKS